MAIQRWEPLTEMDGMRRMLDRMVESMWPGFGRMGTGALDAPRLIVPNIEVYIKDDEAVITAELPGLDPKDVKVEITPEAVHITGEVRREEEVTEDNYFRSERQFGRLERVLPLPQRVREEDAKATFNHGILTIRAPLAAPQQKPKVRQLQIE